MDDRLNLGCDVRELKLGSTFYSQNPRTSFHTLKYDFKPASVDVSKIATLDVSSNNQVTVTVPHLDGSGVPKTVFKGNQRNYTKECVLIIDKITGEITLEKLHHNIQVKKTRSESTTSKNNQILPPIKMENNTQRTMSKTKVSTGLRKTPISAGIISRHSPIQGSPSHPHHKSPNQNNAPVWHANNVQSTLPSIPLIGMDDDDIILPIPHQQQQHHQQQLTNMSLSQDNSNHSVHHLLQQQTPLITTTPSTPITPPPPLLLPQQQQQTISLQLPIERTIQQQQQLQNIDHHNGVGVLSSSDSSSDSESSGSGSDSDSPPNSPAKNSIPIGQHHHNMSNNSIPNHILSEDLCLSESNSDSDDSD